MMISEMSATLGTSERTVWRAIGSLGGKGLISRVGSKRMGRWIKIEPPGGQ